MDALKINVVLSIVFGYVDRGTLLTVNFQIAVFSGSWDSMD